MKSFEEAIKRYLDERAKNDEQFAASYAKENKSIEECCRFIIGEARKKQENRVAVMSDEEVYGLAVHYYDEDNIKVTEPKNSTHVSSTVNYEPTEEDKERAKKAALKRLEEEQLKKLRSPKKKVSTTQPTEQMSLFD
ncbi:MAG: PcfK-like family protein [Muribaculaceae bacterium]|nr:PcfK-like family protein [Muribaculaceae bacterium]